MPSQYAIEKAAQVWCKPECGNKEMDTVLAMAMAETIDASLTVERSVQCLTKALDEDPDFFLSYKANIAMAFQDEFDKAAESLGQEEASNSIAFIANEAAERFLRQWIGKK